MKERIKKICASLMIAAMVVTYMPAMAFAEDGTTADQDQPTQTSTSLAMDDQDLGTVEYTGQKPDLDKMLPTITLQDKTVLSVGQDYTLETVGDGYTVGKQAVKVTFIGGYAEYGEDTTHVWYTVSDESSNYTYTADIKEAELVYDGTVLEASDIAPVTKFVRSDNKVLTEGTDKDNYVMDVKGTGVDAGSEYTVDFKVGGKVVLTKTVKIQKLDLAKAQLQATVETLEYTSKAVEPKVSGVTANGLAVADADYTVAYSNNVNAGDKAVATITAKSASKNFTGKGDVNFTIAAKALTDQNVNAVITKRGTAVYTGSKVTPEVGVRVEFKGTSPVVDVPAADYKVEYDTNINVGTHNVKVVPSGNGNWDGAGVTLANGYDITTADLKDAKITLKEGATVPAREDLSTIAKVLQYFDVKFGDVALTAADFDNSVTVTKTTTRAGQEGEFTLKAAANGNLTGTSAAVTYVAGAEKFGAKYESTYAPVYDGSAKTPIADELGSLTVVGAEGKKTLAKTDYTVVAGSYKENVNVGTATATIEGVADYKGQTAEVSFKIAAKSLDGYTVSKVDGLKSGNYDEGSLLKGASVTLTKTEGGKVVDTVALTADQVTVNVKSFEGTDGSTQKYLKEVEVKLNAGTNYSATSPWTANVEAQKIVATMIDLEDATVTGTIPAGLDWAGNQTNIIKKYITVTVGDTEVTNYGVELKAGTQYALDKEVEFTINKGTSRTIQGTKAAKAKVVARDLSDATLGATIADITAVDYDGTEQKPDPSVTLKDAEYANALVKDTDYTVAYSNNKNAGTATVTVTGKGNYTGSVTKNFTINQIEPKAEYFKDLIVAAADRQFKVGAPEDLSAKLKLEKKNDIEAVAGEYAFKQDAKAVVVGSGAPKAAVEATDKVTDNIYINYTVTFDGTGNFIKGKTLTYKYELVPKTASAADITLENKNVAFDKDANKYQKAVGKVTVAIDGTELKEGTDYTVTYDVPTNEVGKEGTVKVKFTGNYTGQAVAKFSIVKAVIDINNVKIVAPKASELVYKEDENKADLFIANDTKTNLEEPEHFTLVFKDAKGKVVTWVEEAGKYTATVKATDNYGGDEGESLEFEVTKQALSKTQFEKMAKTVHIKGRYYDDPDDYVIDEVEYLGEATKKPELTDNQFEVVSYDKEWDGDYDKQGTAVIALKSDANYQYDGTYNLKYDWIPGDISYSGLEVSDFYKIEDQVYTGSAIEPELVAINDIPTSYATVKYYENNVEIASKTAKAYVVINIPEDEEKYYGELSGVITFSIIADPEAAKTAEEAAEAAAKADEEAAAAVKDADEKAAAADKAMAEAKTDEEKAAAAKLAEEAAAAAKTAEEKTAAAQAANEKAVKAAKDAYGDGSAKAKAAQKKADAAKDAATKAAEASKAATAKADEAKAADAAKAKADAAAATAAAEKITADNYTADSVKAVANAKAALDEAVKGGDTAKITAATKALNDAVAAAKAKKANPLKVTAKKVKAKNAKKTTIKKTKAFKVTGAQGKVTFKKVKGNKKIVVKKSGKIVVKKGLKKGKTYTIKVKVTAAGNGNYKAGSKTVKLKIKVK